MIIVIVHADEIVVIAGNDPSKNHKLRFLEVSHQISISI